MFPAALPFDYLRHFAPNERTRRSRSRPSGSRVRRGAFGSDD